MDPWTRRAEREAEDKAKYAGRVVAVESFYYDGLTDYSTKLWDEATGEVVPGPSYNDSCPLQVDGPGWVVAFVAITKDLARRKREAEDAAYKAEVEARTVRWGKTVKVVRGRKVPKGTVARVFWVGETRWGYRVGLELADGTREFTSSANVEVVQEAA